MQTLYHHALVTTMDRRHPVARALMIEGGKIVQVLDEKPAGLSRDVQEIDLQGGAVVPGFHDCHMHLTDTGLLAGEHDLSDCRSVDEILKRLATFDEPMVYAGNYEEQRLAEGRPPLRGELDAISHDRPVLASRIDGHSCVVNTATLKRFGGEAHDGIEREPSGEPTGKLSGPANYTVQHAFWQKLPPESLRQSDRCAAEVALAAGITTLHNVITGDAPLEQLEDEYRANATLPLNVISKSCTQSVAKAKKLGGRIFGGDIFVDGSIGSRTAALKEPYHDASDDGRLYLGRNELFELFDEAAEAGLSVGVHAIGDRAIEEALSALEMVIATRGPLNGIRPSIDHFEVAWPEQIQRAGRCSMLLSMQPTFDYLWGGDGMYAQRLGQERATIMNAFRTARRAGCIVCGGSDSPVTKLSALLGIHSAVNHHNPNQRLTLDEALRAYTTDAARLSFDEKRRGTLAPGMAADFAVLEMPLDAVPATKIKDLRVLMTVVAGEVRYRAM